MPFYIKVINTYSTPFGLGEWGPLWVQVSEREVPKPNVASYGYTGTPAPGYGSGVSIFSGGNLYIKITNIGSLYGNNSYLTTAKNKFENKLIKINTYLVLYDKESRI